MHGLREKQKNIEFKGYNFKICASLSCWKARLC